MEISEAVAYNLRQERRAQGMSLDILARESGVSKSMLGQIERGEVNPTITVLGKVVRGLKIPFEKLLQQREDPVCLVPDSQVSPSVAPGSTAMRYTLFPYDERRGLEGYRLKLLPAFHQQWEPEVPGCVKYITVFDGQVELELEGEKQVLRQYDSIRFAADIPHSCRNIGTQTANLSVWAHYAL